MSPLFPGQAVQQVLQAVQKLMGHVMEFWLMVCWCGKVHTTLPCLAPTVPYTVPQAGWFPDRMKRIG